MKKKEILLIQPWVEDFYYTDCRKYPLGLTHLAGIIKKTYPQIYVKIIDCLSPLKKKSIQWPKEFNYLKPYFGSTDNSPFSLFHHFYHFGIEEQELGQILKKYDPFLIGISSLFTPYYRETLSVAKICRQYLPSAKIVIGGSHASVAPHKMLFNQKNKSKPFLIDFVIKGEGEKAFSELTSFLIEGRKSLNNINIISRENCDLITKTEFKTNEFIMPDNSSLNLKNYIFDNKLMCFLTTSKGCPHKCTFCSIHTVFGNIYSNRSINDIITEIKLNFKRGIRHFDFEDDNLTFNKKWFVTLLHAIKETGLKITFSAMNGLSYKSLDFEILKLMKETGFENINIAVVSKSRELRFNINRPHSIRKFKEIINIASSLNINVLCSFIIGMPGQTINDIFQTIKLLSENKCLLQPSPFFLTPGTKIYNDLKNNEGIKLGSRNYDQNFSARLTSMDVETDEFKRIDVYTLWRLTRVINYIKYTLDNEITNNDFLDNAFNVFYEKKWYFHGKKDKVIAPFSESVAKIIDENSLMISGYKKTTKILWDNKKQIFKRKF